MNILLNEIKDVIKDITSSGSASRMDDIKEEKYNDEI